MESTDFAKRRPAPVLTRLNYRMWFELMTDFFQSKKISFVIELTEKQYASSFLGSNIFGSASSSSISTPKSESELSQLDDSTPLQANFSWSDEKREKYVSAAADIRYNITLCIDNFDYEYIGQWPHIKQKWDELKKKYFSARPIEAREDMSKLTSFKLKEDMTIEQGWV